jgi:hypothetical protein
MLGPFDTNGPKLPSSKPFDAVVRPVEPAIVHVAGVRTKSTFTANAKNQMVWF